MKKKSADYIGKGLVLALILIVVDLIGGFANLRFESWFRWFSALIIVVALIIFCIQYGKLENNEVTFGKVFGFGFRIALFVSVLMVLYSLLSLYVISPEIKDQVLERTQSEMEAKGSYSQEQIDQAVAMTRKLFLPFAIIGGLITTLIVGIVGSLLGAAFTKKAEPNVFQDKQ